eukprot:CAMPEP_0202974876 /NCGR_PEP_ID=MMETSP1396-20130829/64758_1 /ASSEMBLY_ACC=CAM_ASM_000872 /TAXON_ID= /ORGANISM="Pseudokeronopsis sp., Strain Brazil" /LENGTH=62 /DNA_ID=CAMNT_0049709541 /DNA_START=55 /DNA_END=243 /DNA_ORIENTATION=-
MQKSSKGSRSGACFMVILNASLLFSPSSSIKCFFALNMKAMAVRIEKKALSQSALVNRKNGL